MGTRWTVLALAAARLFAGADDTFERERNALAQTLAEKGIKSDRVLKAMASVPRHLFVPAEYRKFAYDDTVLKINGQTISQPYIVAEMTELLDVRENDRVLEIGAGSGYQTAVLSLVAGELYTIELEPEIARTAADRLRRLGYGNVVVKQGNGYFGWPDKAPFDRIMLTAAPAEVPQLLIDELKPGGRLVAPVGTVVQWLQLIEKTREGRITKRMVMPVRFVPMRQPPAH